MPRQFIAHEDYEKSRLLFLIYCRDSYLLPIWNPRPRKHKIAHAAQGLYDPEMQETLFLPRRRTGLNAKDEDENFVGEINDQPHT